MLTIAPLAVGGETNRPPATVSARQNLCPVMKGRQVNRNLFIDHEGYRIYLCCGPCVKYGKRNPGKVLSMMKEQGILLEKASP
jgi:hypothetical protein